MAQVVILKRAHFFSIDNDIIDVHAKSIGAIGIAIYTVLARFANRRTGECWPAIGRIERTLDLGRSTVKRYLHRLQAAGLITIEERWDEEGDRTSNRYTLLDPDPHTMATRQEPSETPAVLAAAAATEGGGVTATLPSVPAEEAGRSTGPPEPSDPQNQKKETTISAAPLEKTHRQSTCSHPTLEQSWIDGMTICYHCWSIVEDTRGMHTETEVHPCVNEADASHAA